VRLGYPVTTPIQTAPVNNNTAQGTMSGLCDVVQSHIGPSISQHLNYCASLLHYWYPYANDRRSRNLYQKLVPEKLVPVSGTYDMQSCIVFFWYQILVSDRTCSIRYQKLVPVSGTETGTGTSSVVETHSTSFWYRNWYQFLVQVSGTSFW